MRAESARAGGEVAIRSLSGPAEGIGQFVAVEYQLGLRFPSNIYVRGDWTEFVQLERVRVILV